MSRYLKNPFKGEMDVKWVWYAVGLSIGLLPLTVIIPWAIKELMK